MVYPLSECAIMTASASHASLLPRTPALPLSWSSALRGAGMFLLQHFTQAKLFGMEDLTRNCPQARRGWRRGSCTPRPCFYGWSRGPRSPFLSPHQAPSFMPPPLPPFSSCCVCMAKIPRAGQLAYDSISL